MYVCNSVYVHFEKYLLLKLVRDEARAARRVGMSIVYMTHGIRASL